MNTKILELLGEELAKQVTEKLGKVELGIVNDGSLVPADKYDSLKAEHKTLQGNYKTELTELNTKLETAIKGSENAESFKQAIEDLKASNSKTVEEYEGKIQKTKRDALLDIELLKANAKNSKAVKALLNDELIKLDGESLLGVSEQITNLKESDPYLFGEVKKQGTEPAKGVPPTTGKKAELIEMYNKAKPIDKLFYAEQIKKLEE